MLIKIGWFFQKPFAKNKNKNKVFLYWCCIEPYSSFIGLDKNFRNTWYLRVSKILLKFCGVCCDLWCFVKQRRRNGKKLIKTSFRYCLKLSKSYLCKFLLHLFDLLPQHILDKCPVQYGIAPKEEMFLFSSNFFPAPSPCGPCGLAARFRWLLRLRSHQVQENHKHNYLKHQFLDRKNMLLYIFIHFPRWLERCIKITNGKVSDISLFF